MQIHLIAVGRKMPHWVDQAYSEYARRMPRHCSMKLIEINAGKRSKSADVARINREEGERLLQAIPNGSLVIAMERSGKEKNTEQLVLSMEKWLLGGQDVSLLIGGPEGLSQACIERADECWSLSKMTFAHPLVRVVLAEQLYRAWSIIANLPYHRGEQGG
ncbi:MAG: 23S rRNA (pseudouridine(1915)-N(3))-methyltransferase RlmH [Gammaproteobacteria bacterium]|nr:MAG: 23S rRNA (pseudouridine(1915)-N(3))-methyltransferase RlmH [Gammaproteobacteria bacterium]